MYRLHIDIPCGVNQAEAIALAKDTIQQFQQYFQSGPLQGIEVGIRLGSDEDRQKSNYLDLNENGHCSNKKTKVVL